MNADNQTRGFQSRVTRALENVSLLPKAIDDRGHHPDREDHGGTMVIASTPNQGDARGVGEVRSFEDRRNVLAAIPV